MLRTIDSALCNTVAVFSWTLDESQGAGGLPPIVFIIFAIMFLTLGGQRQQQDRYLEFQRQQEYEYIQGQHYDQR